ncbi:MAG TPA: GTP 3',8-cyclase MoaA [Flavisolibacter sp.]|nr:GTP 3',8-cyclase MoaA [Flavisolibacter sp.]
MIYDNHGRLINYLRLAVTDRCNLRCYYCMPHNGLDWLPKKALMSYEEMLRICSLLAKLGVEKIRITGGEPFVRKDLIVFLESLVNIEGIKEVSITTNGVLTAQYIPQLKKLAIQNINLSLDTLNRNRFFAITRRDELPSVLNTFHKLLENDMNVKLNAVVMEGKNTEDIIPLVKLTKNLPISVRFIEEMPFNGDGHQYSGIRWNFLRILEEIQKHFPGISKKKDPPSSTSFNYTIPGHKGSVGIIAAYTRSFCGTCNRVRITPQGILKTCLYDRGVLNIKELMRDGFPDEEITHCVLKSISKRAANGWEAEQGLSEITHPSMASIGG